MTNGFRWDQIQISFYCQSFASAQDDFFAMTHQPILASQQSTTERVRAMVFRRTLTGTTLFRLCYLAFVILSVVYSLVTPVFEASDESRHFAMIDVIRRTGALPVQHPGEKSPWQQEGSQPPLYYVLAIAATFWIDTSDVSQVLRYNPHAFIGQPTAQDNRNLVIHSEREGFPWRGTTLAIHVIRLLGTLMGLGTLLCVTAIAREVAPGREGVALGATALVAFNPMYLFVTASVNNDNLATFLGVLGLLLSLRLWSRGLSFQRALWLGLTIGAASLAKVGGLALIPLALAAVGAAAWRERKWRQGIVAGVIIVTLVGITAGWWYLRNQWLYGEWLGLWTMSIQAGQRPGAPVSLLELLPEWQGFRYSYWGVFGAFNIVLPGWLYSVYDLLLITAAVGLIWEVVQRLRRPGRFDLSRVIEDYGDLVPFALIALQVVMTMAGIIRWTSLTKASQGRLLFPAMGGIATLMAMGLARALHLPLRFGRSPHGLTVARGIGLYAPMLLSLALFTVAALVPFTVIAPAYVPPQPVTEADIPGGARIPEERRVRFGGQVELVGMQVEAGPVRPGDRLEVTVWWQAVAPMQVDYTAFAHVYGPGHVKLGEVNRYPASGWFPTSRWRVGDLWRDTFRVPIQGEAAGPAMLTVEVGLFDADTLAVLTPTTGDGTALGRVIAGYAKLAGKAAAAVDIPPQATRFGDHIFLESVELTPDPPTLRPGDVLSVTLTWRADGRPSRGYTVFVHLISENGQIVTQGDEPPQGGEYPTSFWDAGERIADTHILTIPPDAPPGQYRLYLGLYVLETGERLPILGANGQIIADHVVWPTSIVIR